NVVIVGSPGDNDAGNNSGSAYLFDKNTGQQLFKLVASDAAASDNFGNAVDISGNRAVIGAYFDDTTSLDAGSAYLFDTSSGQQLRKLLPSDGQAVDQFGAAVAVTSNSALVGSALDDDNGLDSGSAYVFNVSTGLQPFKLKPSDGEAQDRFGSSVAISGNIAI